jgi:DNA-binding PadR family transcriptional regulator
LLGLLTFGDELTGYELKQRADLTLRFYWSSPAMSQVYTELGRLADRDLVAPVVEGQTTRYRITGKGRRKLRTWLTSTPPGFPGLKHPVALRLLVAHAMDEASTEAMLEGYLDDLERNRADLQGVRDSLAGRDAPGEPFRNPALVAEWGLAYYDSEAEIARTTLKKLRDGT